MGPEFDAAMTAATARVRAGDPAGATRLIQDALNGGAGPLRLPGGGRPKAWGVKPRIRVRSFARPETRTPPDLPAGATWQARRHEAPAGARDYRLCTPSEPRALVLMLHGCTQDPEDFARGTRMAALAHARGVATAWPEQPRTANPNACWSWFETAHQRAASGEPAILGGLAEALSEEISVPGGRVFVAGLSAGGAMAAVLGETHPHLFDAIGVHSGLPAGAAHDLPSALAAMGGQGGGRAALRPNGPRVIAFHGEADRTVAPSNLDRLLPPGGTGTKGATGSRSWRRTVHPGPGGRTRAEGWRVAGAGHAWFGGDAKGSHADPAGPDASREMLRFFLDG